MNEEKNGWIKKILGVNGHDEEPSHVSGNGGFKTTDKAIATALVFVIALILMLRFKNPELGLILGAVAVGVTVFIWKNHRRG
ncbi:MAG: hypothetical protein AAB091_02685 [Elusimicrobiota bacterium]